MKGCIWRVSSQSALGKSCSDVKTFGAWRSCTESAAILVKAEKQRKQRLLLLSRRLAISSFLRPRSIYIYKQNCRRLGGCYLRKLNSSHLALRCDQSSSITRFILIGVNGVGGRPPPGGDLRGGGNIVQNRTRDKSARRAAFLQNIPHFGRHISVVTSHSSPRLFNDGNYRDAFSPRVRTGSWLKVPMAEGSNELKVPQG
jgi:hypothetical protein